jgi:cytoskeletal protein RodZ
MELEIHQLIESIKQEVGDEIRETLTVEFMQASNNITNSNASLQENVKKLIEVSITEWKLKLKYAVTLLYVMIGLTALLNFYLLFARKKVENQIKINHELIIESRKLIDISRKLIDNDHDLIDDDHRLIEESRRLIEETHKLIEENIKK